jgi:hypothetical protein
MAVALFIGALLWCRVDASAQLHWQTAEFEAGGARVVLAEDSGIR